MRDDPVARLIRRLAESRSSRFIDMWRWRKGLSAPRRLAAVVSYKLLERIVLDRFARRFGPGYAYLANGWHQLVLRSPDGSHVLKVIMDTIGDGLEEAADTARELQAQSDTCMHHLQHHWVDTMFLVLRVPFYPRRYAVAARQALVRPVRTFSSIEEMMGHSMRQEYRAELRSLFDRVERLHAETAMYPDLLPSRNIALVRDAAGRESLQILDTVPQTPVTLAARDADGARTREQAIHDVVDACRLALTTSTKTV